MPPLTPALALWIGPFLVSFAAIAGAWLHARYARKFRLRVAEKEIEAEAPTLHQVEKLLKRGEEMRQAMCREGDR